MPWPKRVFTGLVLAAALLMALGIVLALAWADVQLLSQLRGVC